MSKGSDVKIKEEVYVWLSLIKDLKLETFLRLMKVFHSSYILYNYSKNKVLFKQKLIQSKIYISKDLYYCLINNRLKEKSHTIYQMLMLNKIKIIPIYSKYYIKNLEYMYNAPLALFVKGNFEILDIINVKKKIFIYKNSEISKYGKSVYDNINNYLLSKDCINVYKIKSINQNEVFKEIVYLNYKDSSILFISIENYENNIYYKMNQIISGISDILIVPESGVNLEINNMVETFLELGKDLLVVPGNIYNKTSYFSNILIKEGAEVILKNNDLDSFL